MQLIDRPTVKRVEGTAPGAFCADREDLYNDFRSGRIFGNVPEQKRGEIWNQLCKVTRQCLVPSLFTFFEDRKFLSPVAESMRRLTGVNSKVTVPSRLDEMFQHTGHQVDQCIVQTSDTSYVIVPGDTATRFDLGCRQLWLVAFREFRDLPADIKKKDRLAKSRKKVDETTLFEFGSLANRLGFESKDISTILETSPDRQAAERVLLSARKPGKYRYPDFEHCVQQMMAIFATAQPVPTNEMPHCTEMGQCVEPPVRCGIPHDSDHDRDQSQLFLPNILLDYDTEQTHLTSFFVRRSVYIAYFGLPLSAMDSFANYQQTTHVDLAVDGACPSTVQEEEIKLNRLKELSRNEQAKLDRLQESTRQQEANLACLIAHNTVNDGEVDMPDASNITKPQKEAGKGKQPSRPTKTRKPKERLPYERPAIVDKQRLLVAKRDKVAAKQGKHSTMDVDAPEVQNIESTPQQTPSQSVIPLTAPTSLDQPILSSTGVSSSGLEGGVLGPQHSVVDSLNATSPLYQPLNQPTRSALDEIQTVHTPGRVPTPQKPSPREVLGKRTIGHKEVPASKSNQQRHIRRTVSRIARQHGSTPGSSEHSPVAGNFQPELGEFSTAPPSDINTEEEL